MKTVFLFSAIWCTLLFAVSAAQAGPLHKHVHKYSFAHNHRVVSRPVTARAVPVRVVAAIGLASLPAGYVRFIHDNEAFYYYEGVYYQKQTRGYVVVQPRTGFRVASLPNGYKVTRHRGKIYYSFNNVRYRKQGSLFVVV
jgi:hypothetical protein